MVKVYKHPPYSWWRDFVFWVAMTPVVLASYIIGGRYINKILDEMYREAEPIRPDTPGHEKGWVDVEPMPPPSNSP